MSLRQIAAYRSQLGSGASVEVFADEQGNEWTSIGGRKPSLTRTSEQIERKQRLLRLGAALRRREERRANLIKDGGNDAQGQTSVGEGFD